MATITTGTVINNVNTPALNLSTGQDVIVEFGAYALSADQFAALDLKGSGAQNYTVNIAGTVSGYGANTTGIFFNGITSGVHQVIVQATGQVFGQDGGIIANSGHRIETLTNLGSISTNGSSRPAIDVIGTGGTVIDNRGTIASAASSAVRIAAGSLETNLINNVGIISAATAFAIQITGAFSSLDTIDNTGTIFGNLSLGLGSDTLTNTGTVIGDVFMENGEDSVDNRDGVIIGLVNLGEGSDTYLGSLRIANNVDNVEGGAGNDTLNGGAGADNLNGGSDNDLLIGGEGADVLIGGTGIDTYVVDSQGDTIIENAGIGLLEQFDLVLASVNFELAADDDIEFMSTTNDLGTSAINLTGNGAKQTITGNAGNNVLDGGQDAFNDGLIGLQGNDTYIVRSTNDAIIEGAGQGTLDTVRAAVNYTLGVSAQVEVVQTISSTANTTISLTGNAFAQAIYGNAGANLINGAGGNDRLKGGLGNDAFIFNTTPNAASNRDLIKDFSASASGNNDTIRLENAIFKALVGTGTLSSAQFFAGTTAHDANDRIIYNKTTGALIYDNNGNAAGGAVQFATLSNKPANVTNFDFLII